MKRIKCAGLKTTVWPQTIASSMIWKIHQSFNSWFLTDMISLKYRQCQRDRTLFIKHYSYDGKLTLLFYVDDMVIASNSETEKHVLREKLATQFEMKEFSMYFLGIEVAYSRKGIFISQESMYLIFSKEQTNQGVKHLEFQLNRTTRLEVRRKAQQQRSLNTKIGGKSHLFIPHQTKHFLCCKCRKSIHA